MIPAHDGAHRLLSAGQVATRLGISPSRVARLVLEGRLQCYAETKVGRIFDVEHVEAVARERAEAARHDSRITPPARAEASE